MFNMTGNQIDRIVVTIEDQYLPEIHAVASALQATGVKVDNILPVSGIITGEVSHLKINDLQKVSGVASVELDEQMHAI